MKNKNIIILLILNIWFVLESCGNTYHKKQNDILLIGAGIVSDDTVIIPIGADIVSDGADIIPLGAGIV